MICRNLGEGNAPPPDPLVPTAPTCGTGGTGPAGLSKLVLYCRISCSKGPFSRGALHTFWHRLRMYDGYFPNSFRPNHIWDIFGLGLKSKQTFLWKKTTEWWKSWTSAKYHKIHSANLPNWPKILGYLWKKASSCVRSPCILPSAQQTTYSSAEWHWQRAATTEHCGAARRVRPGRFSLK